MGSTPRTDVRTTGSGVTERLGACLGEVAEIRACRLREMLRAQGVELTGPTKVSIQSPGGEQEITLVPDVIRILAPRWLIVAPCCGKRRLALYWHPIEKRFGCRLCMDVRSARDRLRNNSVLAPLLQSLGSRAGGRRRSPAGDARVDAGVQEGDVPAEVEARVGELMRVSGAEGNLVEPLSTRANRGAGRMDHE